MRCARSRRPRASCSSWTEASPRQTNKCEFAQGPGPGADREGVDYTNWSKEDLLKLRVMQREEGAGPEETDAVELEIRRREPARTAAVVPTSARAPAPVPALVGGRPFVAPAVSSDTSTDRPEVEAPPFALSAGPPGSMAISRYAFVRALSAWLWFVAGVIGLAGAIVTYYAADGTGGARIALTVIGAIGAATPYLALIVFMKLASETAQGVTWITGFLHDHH